MTQTPGYPLLFHGIADIPGEVIKIHEKQGDKFHDDDNAVDGPDSESGDIHDKVVSEFRLLETSDISEPLREEYSFVEFHRGVPKQVPDIHTQFFYAFHGSLSDRLGHSDDFPEHLLVLVLMESGKFFPEGREIFRSVYDGDEFEDFLMRHFGSQPP